MQKLTGDGVLAKVNKIVIEDGHVYAAGAYRDAVNGGSWQGAIWIDGEMTLFTEKVGIEVGGLYVKDGNWIVNGNMTLEDGTISAYNWYSDGSVEALTPGAALCQGLGVTKLGDDVYSLTCTYSMDMSTYEDIYKSSLLKNKEKVEMEVHSDGRYQSAGLESICKIRIINEKRSPTVNSAGLRDFITRYVLFRTDQLLLVKERVCPILYQSLLLDNKLCDTNDWYNFGHALSFTKSN